MRLGSEASASAGDEETLNQDTSRAGRITRRDRAPGRSSGPGGPSPVPQATTCFPARGHARLVARTPRRSSELVRRSRTGDADRGSNGVRTISTLLLRGVHSNACYDTTGEGDRSSPPGRAALHRAPRAKAPCSKRPGPTRPPDSAGSCASRLGRERVEAARFEAPHPIRTGGGVNRSRGRSTRGAHLALACSAPAGCRRPGGGYSTSARRLPLSSAPPDARPLPPAPPIG